MGELDSRVAVVTGGGRGIGAAVATALAERGAAVAVSARGAAEIAAVAGALRAAGHRALAVPCDVTDEAAVAALRGAVESELGPADLLINNAGASSSAPLARTSLEEWNRIFAVNATGTFLVTRELLPGMVERGWGRVVNVASVAGRAGGPYIAPYTAAKHAVIGLTRSLAAEVSTSGVTVNAVCPGYVDTPMTDWNVDRLAETTGRDRETIRDNLRRQSPQNRLFAAEEVAYLVACLCSPQAAGIHGQSLVLDGGGRQA